MPDVSILRRPAHVAAAFKEGFGGNDEQVHVRSM